MCFVNWIDGNSIVYDLLTYTEGDGLIAVVNLSKSYFPSFPRVQNSSDRNPEGQSRIALFIRSAGSFDSDRNSRPELELLTQARTPDSRRNSRQWSIFSGA